MQGGQGAQVELGGSLHHLQEQRALGGSSQPGGLDILEDLVVPEALVALEDSQGKTYLNFRKIRSELTRQ